MSQQLCPKCGVKAISWSIDAEESPFTKWRCGNCDYVAEEFETNASGCQHCATPKVCLLVKDAEGIHRWCNACGLFVRLESPDLVQEALSSTASFKSIVMQLRKEPPSRTGAKMVVDAHRSGDAAPWLAALLLGGCRDEIGYATVREILLAAPRQCAESYAGVALARIGGPGALADLKEIMLNAPERRSREGAAWGVEFLGLTEAAPAVIDAGVAGRINRESAARILSRIFPDEGVVLGLLNSTDSNRIRIGLWIIDECLSSRSRGDLPEQVPAMISRPSLKLLEAVARVLQNAEIPIAPRKREGLRSWINLHARE